MAGMVVPGDREHQVRKVEAEARAAAEENAALKARVERLEQELSEARCAEEKALVQVGELTRKVKGFEASREALKLEAVDAFRSSTEYAEEVGAKAAAKIHDTYVVAEKFLKEQPDGGFDGFIEVFLAAEEERARGSLANAEAGAADP